MTTVWEKRAERLSETESASFRPPLSCVLIMLGRRRSEKVRALVLFRRTGGRTVVPRVDEVLEVSSHFRPRLSTEINVSPSRIVDHPATTARND